MISHKDSNARNRRCTSARIAQTKQGPEVNITRALHAARRPLTRVARSAWTAAKARILGVRQKAVILNLGPAHVILRADIREKTVSWSGFPVVYSNALMPVTAWPSMRVWMS